MMRAAQEPFWQKQPPPQSMVPCWQTCVHAVPPHDDAWATGTHAVAWQQVAGTQSESALHLSLARPEPHPTIARLASRAMRKVFM